LVVAIRRTGRGALAFVGAGGLLAFALQVSPALAAPCLSGTQQSLTVTNAQAIDLCGHVTSAVTIRSGGVLATEDGSTIGGGVTAQAGAVSLQLEGTQGPRKRHGDVRRRRCELAAGGGHDLRVEDQWLGHRLRRRRHGPDRRSRR
jgi:hypothetical protein